MLATTTSLVYACIKIAMNRSQPKLIQSRNFKNYNKEVFGNELRNALLHDFNEKLDTNPL